MKNNNEEYYNFNKEVKVIRRSLPILSDQPKWDWILIINGKEIVIGNQFTDMTNYVIPINKEEKKDNKYTEYDLARLLARIHYEGSENPKDANFNFEFYFNNTDQKWLQQANNLLERLHTTNKPKEDNDLFTDEELGMIVRDEWIKWAKEQPIAKLSWLKPWNLLTLPEKEVDIRIAKEVIKNYETKRIYKKAQDRIRNEIQNPKVFEDNEYALKQSLVNICSILGLRYDSGMLTTKTLAKLIEAYLVNNLKKEKEISNKEFYDTFPHSYFTLRGDIVKSHKENDITIIDEMKVRSILMSNKIDIPNLSNNPIQDYKDNLDRISDDIKDKIEGKIYSAKLTNQAMTKEEIELKRINDKITELKKDIINLEKIKASVTKLKDNDWEEVEYQHNLDALNRNEIYDENERIMLSNKVGKGQNSKIEIYYITNISKKKQYKGMLVFGWNENKNDGSVGKWRYESSMSNDIKTSKDWIKFIEPALIMASKYFPRG